MSLKLAAKDDGRETLLARYRAMAEEGSDIIVLHEGGRIVFATSALGRLLKRAPEEFQNSLYLNFVHPDDMAEALKLLGRPPPGETWTATYRVRHGDGHYIWFETRTRGVYDETTGAFLREVSVGRDITERKENELRIRAAQDRAEAANRAKSAFLANMSHELRTPLNAVMGFAETMEHELFGPLGNTRYREYAASIRQESERLLAMVSNILDVARIESGRFELQPQIVDVNEVVAECFGFVSGAAEKSGIALERSLSADALWADASAIRKMVLNLVSNAVKFTASGGRVRVETAREAGEFVLRVRDSGCGMAEEQLLRLSQPFAQLCSEAALARKGAGAGVGLALVRALTEAHGGRMHIDSAPGEGTTVTLRFPVDSNALCNNSKT